MIIARKFVLIKRSLMGVLFGVCLSAAATSGPTLAVLYPQVKDPYKKVFLDIIEGIKSEAGKSVVAFELGKKDDFESITDWLEQQSAEAVISLGNRGKKIASDLPSKYKVITGASILSNKNIEGGLYGISLTPSPAKLFSKLREFAPEVTAIRVIYHEPTNGWLIKYAKQSAQNLNLEFVAQKADNVRAAAILYRKLLEELNPNEAIWLLQGDPTLDERSLLPDLLNQAWNKNLIIFSSNPSHVKRGALFSLFPDNSAMGKSLAIKLQRLVDDSKGDAAPLEDLRIAVNVRTAAHLNLKFSRAMQRNFDMVFPHK